MTFPRRASPAVVTLALALAALLAACESSPTAMPTTQAALPSPSVDESSPPDEVGFEPAAWPTTGSACDLAGYTGLMGRIEATAARTVRFTLCRPDAAFPARIAHPAMGILDTATIGRLSEDRSTATAIAGSGPYRIDAWTPGDNVRLVRVDPDPSAGARAETIVLRWAESATARIDALQNAEVDGIDDPSPASLDRIATLPELDVIPRAGMSMAYLGFGDSSAFDDVTVRRAVAQALDRDALTAAFPPGSTAATHLVPCAIPDGCAGRSWYGFNGPAAAAALKAAGFDLQVSYPLQIPDQPVPGLPDPAAIASAVQSQLATNVGLAVDIEVLPVADYAARLAAGTLDGLYLGGLASQLPDAATFLMPLFGEGATGTSAQRAPAVAGYLATAAMDTDPGTRTDAVSSASNTIRGRATAVPLVEPGTVAVFRSDVRGATTAPLGLDPLGATVAGDRSQSVFMQATEPDGAYCGDQVSDDAYRLCALVTTGLYGLDPATLAPLPRLAQSCEPDADAVVWTCRLRPRLTFHDGASLDARDVLDSFVAQWDRSSALRRTDSAGFDTWTELFGATIGGS
jgi:peptide/nickel transport system substrate-binding protein